MSFKNPLEYKVKYYSHRIILHGSMQDHYKKLERYLEALKIGSLETYLLLVTNPFKKTLILVFHKLFVCFDGLKTGW